MTADTNNALEAELTMDDVASARAALAENDSIARHPRARAGIEQRLKEPLKPHAIPYEDPQLTVKERLLDGVHRGAEIILALAGLVVTAPIMAVTALLIRRDSPGPALFRMERAARSKLVRGRHLSTEDYTPPQGGFEPDKLYWVPASFRFVKFRTMWVDAAERFPEYYWWNYDIDPDRAQGMYYKLIDDPRLTGVGRWLRKTSLDELPNLWNVFTGDLRLIGPRPETPGIQAFYSAEQMKKFTVRPGISGPAEVYGRSELSVGERIVWDLEYVRTRSALQDIKYLFQTIGVVLTRKGAR